MPFDPQDIEAVVFDMDGVLLDSEILYKQATFQAAKHLGFEMSEEVHMATIGIPGDLAETVIRKGMGSDFPFDEFDILWREWMAAQMMRHVPVKPGVRELLTLLNQLEVPIAVATSTRSEPAHHHLMRADLVAHFATIVTRDDVDNGKPHPEPYLLAAERLEFDPEQCLAIEDSYNGVRSAYAAGMNTIMVPDLLPSTSEMEGLTIAVLKDLHEVRRVFEDD